MRANLKLLACLPLLLALLLPGSAGAQEAGESAALRPLTAEAAAAFDETLADIELADFNYQRLQERVDASEGLAAEILGVRRDKVWIAMFRDTLDLAEEIANERDDGKDVSVYIGHISGKLSELSVRGVEAINHLSSDVEFPSEDLPPRDFVIDDQELFQRLRLIDEVYAALIGYVELAGRYDQDTSDITEFVTSRLEDSAANRSVFLEVAINDIKVLRASLATLPDDTVLAEWLGAAQTRVAMTAAAMQQVVDLMDSLDLETRHYRQQILTVTGEITTDILDVGIIAGLMSEWTLRATALTASEGPRLVFRILLIALILFLFFQLSRVVRKGMERALQSNRVRMSNLLRRMIISTLRNIVILVGVLIAIGQLGISLGPVLAGLGIAGFIIGFALQDSLSNFASGIMILSYQPFDVGDVVDAGGIKGKVSHMSLVNTTFMTLDNQKLIVPNNLIWGSVITNVTAQKTRRIDLVFTVAYDDDIDKVEQVLGEVIQGHESILDYPEPTIRLNEFGDSGSSFIVRPWVKTADYWNTYWDVVKTVKLRFEEEGISIPFPQRDIRILKQE